MANEIENSLQAAIKVDGADPPTVLASAGFVAASVTRTGTGEYTLDLVRDIGDAEDVLSCCVEDDGAGVARRIQVNKLSTTQYQVQVWDGAQVAPVLVDGNFTLLIWRTPTRA